MVQPSARHEYLDIIYLRYTIITDQDSFISPSSSSGSSPGSFPSCFSSSFLSGWEAGFPIIEAPPVPPDEAAPPKPPLDELAALPNGAPENDDPGNAPNGLSATGVFAVGIGNVNVD
mmetsp:Transcript_36353/g.87777  ORF Transcript_36353/g.87777 Transcript_36353/m.87777 type:complete len:117 (+) Transcript_36353:843-1193(+)